MHHFKDRQQKPRFAVVANMLTLFLALMKRYRYHLLFGVSHVIVSSIVSEF